MFMRATCVYSLSFPFLSLTDGIVIHAVIQSLLTSISLLMSLVSLKSSTVCFFKVLLTNAFGSY